MPQINVPGTLDASQSKADEAGRKTETLKIAGIRTFRIEATRGAEAGASVKAADDEVAELEFGDGIRLWVRADELDSYFPQKAGRGERAAAIRIEPALALGTPSRGVVGQLILKTLRLIRIDAAAGAAQAAGRALEDKLKNGGGLYRCARDRYDLLDVAASQIPVGRPILVFIHGTFSSTQGSFGDLWDGPQAGQRLPLFQAYDGHVYGFEHRSVSESPIRNAIKLVEALPAGARLHLVSHSRGGLVGELVCRGFPDGARDPFDEADRKAFPDDARRGEIDELNRLLKTRNVRVERFVRVACPTRGTTLASGRLDRWLSVLVNLLGMVPAFKASGLFDALSEFALAVVRERADPAAMPGLEAVMPESPLMAVINRPDVQVQGELRVIAGDIEESGLWGRLKLLLPDYFYGGEHDLVVNTSSMWGGARRTNGERFFFDQGPGVNHVRYFENEASVRRLMAALTAKDPQDDGFDPLVARPVASIPRAVRSGRADLPRPVVFLLPGIMGSHLAIGDNRVWVDPIELALGGMGKIAIDKAGVHAACPLESVYGDLIDYLAQTHEVRPFAYDWRRSMREEARRLAGEVAAALDRAEAQSQPVRLLAHSMGGLVARVMIQERPDIWQRLCRHEGGRLVMLGTPNGGSHSMVCAILARDAIVRRLTALDLGHDTKSLLEVIARYPGVLELLPSDKRRDYFAAETWNTLMAADAGDRGGKWVKPADSQLQAAAQVRQALAAGAVDAGRMLYVAGCAASTPCDIEIDDDAAARRRIRVIGTAAGDGRVPWETGRLPGVKTWYMEAAHGDLCRHEPAFEALRELLELGQTQRLSAIAPVTRGAAERFTVPEETAPLYPDYEDLATAAVGGSRRARRAKGRHQLRAHVAHGNLAFTRHAVAVGHYAGDTIISAEAYLDRVLDGRLRDRHRLGLYPGADDTCEVFLNPGRQPGGAIVVGLGRVGTLTPGRLRRYMTRACLDFAVATAESRGAGHESGRAAVGIAALLIGTGAGNMTVENSLAALLAGIVDANHLLAESGYGARAMIDEVEFLELYEDRAIQAVRALHLVMSDPMLAEHVVPDLELHTLEGGRRRASFEEEKGWAQRLQIEEQEDGSLRFVVLTDLARAEGALQLTQRELIDGLVGEAMASATEQKQVAVTLFELLVPNRLKQAAPEQRDLVLVVDKGSARYPWELLRDRMSPGDEPMVVRSQCVRQLYTESFRERVAMTHLRSALVVGDPPSRFQPLPGAQQEAAAVAKRLESAGFEVTQSIAKDHRHVLNALYARDYRLLHLAAHGVYEYELPPMPSRPGEPCPDAPPKPRKVTGMVLGDDLFLTPVEINQMRVVPELVFINCCFLGRVNEPALRRDRSGLAANLATQLIEMGVRAVVAAGWEVDDAAAALFAETFYAQMLSGRSFGQALLEARKQTYATHSDVNTWGAYQAYGDPDFALGGDGSRYRDRGGTTYFAPAEVVVALENICADAKTADPAQVEALGRQVAEMEKGLLPHWRELPEAQVALGAAYGELGRYAPAVERYKAALGAEDGCVPLTAVEQLCNLQVRWASELAHAGARKERGSAIAEVADAQTRLAKLIDVAPNAERYSLLGSACLRQAALVGGEERMAALEKAVASYGKALERAQRAGRGAGFYPRKNRLAASVVLSLLRGEEAAGVPPDVEAELEQIAADAASAGERRRDFWNAIAPVECELLRRMMGGDLERQADTIVDAYREANRGFGSPRQLRSVVEHLALLGEILAVKGADRLLARVVRGLKKIRAGLAN